jgi:serine/threonine protein kinase
MDTFEILETIYHSPKSVIYKARSLKDYHVYALKKFSQNRNAGTSFLIIPLALNEIKAHKAFQVSFVVALQDYFEDDEGDKPDIVSVLEYCNQGDLRSYIR